MKDSLRQIKMLIGHVIVALIVELYLYEDEDTTTINDIEIAFDNGISFVFSCSGEGGVSVRKGKARIYPNLEGVRLAKLIHLDCCIGSKLEGISEIGNSIVLNIDGKELTFTNEDDELIMRLNNHEVTVKFC